jgi:hypothetical protein
MLKLNLSPKVLKQGENFRELARSDLFEKISDLDERIKNY